jgi:hypothetical protein
MAAKRKYARMSDPVTDRFECTNRKCKWQGNQNQKAKVKKEDWTVDVCPKCGSEEFFGLLK